MMAQAKDTTEDQFAVSQDSFGGWHSYSIEGGSEPGKARSSAKTPVATGVLDTLRERI